MYTVLPAKRVHFGFRDNLVYNFKPTLAIYVQIKLIEMSNFLRPIKKISVKSHDIPTELWLDMSTEYANTLGSPFL